jgi:hypothetical protein
MAAGAGTHAGGRCEHCRPAGGYLGLRLSAADAELKSVRAANYIKTLRRDLVKVAEACGVEHPGLISTDAVEILDGRTASTPLSDVYGYAPDWGLPNAADRAAIIEFMTATETQGGTAPPSPTAADQTG